MIFRVSVIIPNYNGQELLEKNLPAIINAFHNHRNKICETIIVDNGSTDGSVSLIRQKFPEVKIIRHKVNRGFSAAVNTGVRAAKGNLLAFINTDVTPSIDFVFQTLKYFNDEKVFAVSLHEKGFGPAVGRFQDGFVTHEPMSESDTKQATFWVSGGTGIFKRDIFLELGSFDEKLFSPFYWEDVDLSYRALKKGYKLLWVPDAYVVHEHESTAKKFSNKFRQRIQERNQLIFVWKNISSRRLIKKHIIGLFSRLTKHPKYLLIVIMALFKLPVILKSKKRTTKGEKVSDEAIFSSFK